MYDREALLKSSDYSSQYFLKLLQQNINKLELPVNTRILNLRISRQKFKRLHTSNRQGFKITVTINPKHPSVKPTFWFKQVDNPRELYNSLTFVHSALKRDGIHSPVPEPFLFDENAGGMLMSFKKGLNLLHLTLVFCLPLTAGVVSKLGQYYYQIGNWLQRFHDAMGTGRLVTTRSILEEVQYKLSNYELISDAERYALMDQTRSLFRDSIATTTFETVRPHNDVTLRNILVKRNLDFVLIDWDNMVNPGFPQESWCWSDLSCLLNNMQSLLRFHPLVSKTKISYLCQSLLEGYFDKKVSVSEITIPVFLDTLHYIQTLRSFLGIETDRSLVQIHTSRLTWRFVSMLRTNLLKGRAYIL